LINFYYLLLVRIKIKFINLLKLKIKFINLLGTKIKYQWQKKECCFIKNLTQNK